VIVAEASPLGWAAARDVGAATPRLAKSGTGRHACNAKRQPIAKACFFIT